MQSYKCLIPKTVLSVIKLAHSWDRQPATIYNWIKAGVLVDGKTIYLKATKLGGGYLIHPEDAAEFLAAQNRSPEQTKTTSTKIDKSMAQRIAKALVQIDLN